MAHGLLSALPGLQRPRYSKNRSNGLAFTADACPAQTEGVDDVTPPSLKEPDILMFRWLSRPWP